RRARPVEFVRGFPRASESPAAEGGHHASRLRPDRGRRRPPGRLVRLCPRDRRPPCVPRRRRPPPSGLRTSSGCENPRCEPHAAVRARYGPRGPRRRIGESPPHVRGAAPSGAFSGGLRRHALPAPPTRTPRAPPSPRRGLPAARPREGILPPTDGGPPAAGGARPRGLILDGP